MSVYNTPMVMAPYIASSVEAARDLHLPNIVQFDIDVWATWVTNLSISLHTTVIPKGMYRPSLLPA